jgi:hypothetical protein
LMASAPGYGAKWPASPAAPTKTWRQGND